MPSEQHRAQVRSRLSIRSPPAAARSGLIAASSAPGRWLGARASRIDKSALTAGRKLMQIYNFSLFLALL